MTPLASSENRGHSLADLLDQEKGHPLHLMPRRRDGHHFPPYLSCSTRSSEGAARTIRWTRAGARARGRQLKITLRHIRPAGAVGAPRWRAGGVAGFLPVPAGRASYAALRHRSMLGVDRLDLSRHGLGCVRPPAGDCVDLEGAGGREAPHRGRAARRCYCFRAVTSPPCVNGEVR